MRNSMIGAINSASQVIAGYNKKKEEMAEKEKKQKKLENMQKYYDENKDTLIVNFDEEGNPQFREKNPQEISQQATMNYKQSLIQKKQSGIPLTPSEEYTLSGGYKAPVQSAADKYYERLNNEARGDFNIDSQQPQVETPQGIPTGLVTVKSPDGVEGTIPSNQLDEALKAGYTKVQ